MAVTTPIPAHSVPAPTLLTLTQTAGELQVSLDSVRRWIRNGDLEAVVLPSGRLRVPISAVRALPRTGTDRARGRNSKAAA